MMRQLVLSLLIFGLIQGPALADRLAPPNPYVVSSPSGQYYFKMLPDMAASEHSLVGRGMMYAVGKDGNDTLLWETMGWYAYNVYVPEGGKHVVRLGNWAMGCAPEPQDLAVAFYQEGAKIKSYSTADLVQDSKSIDCSISHYSWYKKVQGITQPSNYHFSLTTVEDKTYTFNAKTGEIVTP